ncbi:MAG: SDR family oxidoreductase [Bdellovibrionales bacterium]
MHVNGFRPKRISDQAIVITGASSGIGLATAKMAAKRGAKVVISSRNGEELKRIAEKLSTEGHQVLAVEADVSRFEDMEKLRDRAIEKFGRIDTWINNAGVSIYGRILDVPWSDERQLFETNFWGVRNGCRAVVPILEKEGGVLINIGSEVSGAAIPLQGMYSASKHAIKAYTDVLRMELEHDGKPVAVCLIRPAAIDTPFTEHARNFLEEGEPSLAPPIYAPEVAARAILNCAESPERDVYVGSPSRMATVMEAFFPRLMDMALEYGLFESQTRGTGKAHRRSHEALHHPPRGEGHVRGAHQGRIFKRSLYTSATQHPWRTLVFAGAAAALVAGLTRSSARPRGPQEEVEGDEARA